MLKKALVGAGLAAAIMIPSGVAIAQPWDGSTDIPDAVNTEQVRLQNRLHEPGECQLDGEPGYLGNYDGIGDHDRDRDRVHATDQLRDPARSELNGMGLERGAVRDGTGAGGGSAFQFGLGRS